MFTKISSINTKIETLGRHRSKHCKPVDMNTTAALRDQTKTQNTCNPLTRQFCSLDAWQQIIWLFSQGQRVLNKQMLILRENLVEIIEK